MTPPFAHSTLLLVLGAKEYPEAGLLGSAAFERAACSLSTYFVSGYQLPLENLLYFFDTAYEPNALDTQIAKTLKERLNILRTKGGAATDLVVYYVGHGWFDERRNYCLSLRSSRADNKAVSSLRIESLLTTLHKHAGDLRKYIIIDACYAAEAAFLQSSPSDALAREVETAPKRGEVFLCSSSRHVVSEWKPDASNTFFAEALTDVLWEGSEAGPAYLSVRAVHKLVERRLAQLRIDYIHPELHTPGQPEGDIADVALFPNGPRRLATLAADSAAREQAITLQRYLRQQAEDQNREIGRRNAERQARDEEVRRQALEEQERERSKLALSATRYSSDEERTFRNAAEEVEGAPADLRLLADWLEWRALRSRIEMTALEQESRDQLEEASTEKFYARNVYSNIEVARKAGSSEQITVLERLYYDHREQAKRLEAAAAISHGKAEEADAAATYYARLAQDQRNIAGLAAVAFHSGLTFEKKVAEGLQKPLRRVRRRHNLGRFWRETRRWTVRMIVFLAAALMIATCVMDDLKGSTHG